jgi:glycerol-3-phosphate O-acyltransferase
MLVHEASKSGGISKEQFEKAIISFVGRLSALSGIADPEVFDLKAARALLDRLKSQDLLYEPEPGKLFTTERIAKYEMHWRRLLDPQIWDGVRMYVEEFHKQA